MPSGAAPGPILVETATGQSESLEFTLTEAATFSPSTIEWHLFNTRGITYVDGGGVACAGHFGHFFHRARSLRARTLARRHPSAYSWRSG